MSAPIELVESDPTWPARFELEKELLLPTIAPWLRGPIEHIGSTAIAGMRAKPVIDILAGVRSLEASREAIAALHGLEYQYWPYKADVMHWFCKPSDEVRTHHLHLVPFGSPLYLDRLAFRDYLRRNASAAAEYSALKVALAARFRNDREAYTRGKGEFVERILVRARSPWA